MTNITKPVIKDLEQIKNILSQWNETKEVEKYISRISNEIHGKTEFNMQFWVAKEGDTVIGVVGLCSPLPKILPFAKTDNPGEIKILYLDRRMQGNGVGRSLVKYIEKQAIRQEYSELLIRSAEKYRKTAYGFYEKIGYSKIGIIEGENESKRMQVFDKVLQSFDFSISSLI